MKLVIAIMVIAGAAVALSCQKSYADSFYSINPTNNGPGNVPASIINNANNQCVAIANAYGTLYPVGQLQWLSAVGDPTNQSITVVSGAGSAAVQWNVATFFCDYSGQTYHGVRYNGYYATSPGDPVPTYAVVSVSSTTPGVATSGLLYQNGGINALTVTPNPGNLWNWTNKTFTMSVPNGVTQVTLSENDKVINTFPNGSSAISSGGKYECVGAIPGKTSYANGYFRNSNLDFFGVNGLGVENPPTSSSSPPACGNYPTNLTANINVISGNIQGRVVNQATGQGVPNVPIYNCYGNQTTTTDSTGNYTFSVQPGAAFCLRPQSFSYVASDGKTYPISSGQLYNRPWGFDYGDPASRCPAYGATSPPYAGNCSPVNVPPIVIESNQTYECQIAGHNGAEPCPGNAADETWVNSGGGRGYDFVFNYTPPSSSPCPNWPTAPATFPKVSTTLPNTAQPAAPGGADSGSGGQSGATTTKSQQYYQYTPQTNFRIDSAQDQYAPATGISTSANIGTWQNSPNFTLDYSNYYRQYPYDPHNTTIGYTQDWTQTYWYTSSNIDYWTCPPGQSPASSTTTSTCTYTAPTNMTCPAGFTYENPYYYNYDTGTGGYGGNGCWQSQGVGGSCNFSQATVDTYGGSAWCSGGAGTAVPYCNGTDTLSGSTCTSTDSTAWYNWHKGSSSTVTNSDTYNGAPAMPACYDRTFTVGSVSASANLDDPEDPTTGTVQGTVSVTFGYPAGDPTPAGLRNPMVVNLSYDRTVTGCNNGTDTSTNNPTTITGLYEPSTVTGALDTPAFSCTFTAPPHVAGDMICGTYTVVPTGTTMDWQGNVTSSNGVSATSSPDPTCSSPLTNIPYAHFMGGDVSAGGAFANGNDACAGENPSASANITAFVKGSGALTRGSGTQFAALANGSITNFGSAILRAANNYPTAQNGLSFANTSGSTGYLGASMCEPDFFSTNVSPMTTLASGGTIKMASLDSSSTAGEAQDVYYSPPVGSVGTAQYTLSGFSGAGQGISNGNRIALYVNGDVYIQNDIKFKNTAWTQVSDIPSFYLIVKGNIYISPNVHELDGVYVAESNGGSGGVVNTCAPGFSAYTAANLFNSCQSQLSVNGAFVASNVELYRTYASLRNSLGGEYPTGAVSPDDCTAGDKGTVDRAATANMYDCGAEIFNLTPDVLLGQPAIGTNATPDDGKFDFITSLSPVL